MANRDHDDDHDDYGELLDQDDDTPAPEHYRTAESLVRRPETEAARRRESVSADVFASMAREIYTNPAGKKMETPPSWNDPPRDREEFDRRMRILSGGMDFSAEAATEIYAKRREARQRRGPLSCAAAIGQ